MSDFNISNISSIDETDRQSAEILNQQICSTNFLDDKTIVIYNPYGYCESCGGRTVLHYIGKLLKEKNINVKMYAGNESYDRPIFSDFITEYDPDKIIVIYPELTTFNPLNAKYVIRWILAPVGKNAGEGQIHLWDKNDLVYYFLSEEKMKNEPEKQEEEPIPEPPKAEEAPAEPTIEEPQRPPPKTENPPPPPKEFKRKPKAINKEPTEQELYSNASVAMLRQKLFEQTRKRLVNELFNY